MLRASPGSSPGGDRYDPPGHKLSSVATLPVSRVVHTAAAARAAADRPPSIVPGGASRNSFSCCVRPAKRVAEDMEGTRTADGRGDGGERRRREDARMEKARGGSRRYSSGGRAGKSTDKNESSTRKPKTGPDDARSTAGARLLPTAVSSSPACVTLRTAPVSVQDHRVHSPTTTPCSSTCCCAQTIGKGPRTAAVRGPTLPQLASTQCLAGETARVSGTKPRAGHEAHKRENIGCALGVARVPASRSALSSCVRAHTSQKAPPRATVANRRALTRSCRSLRSYGVCVSGATIRRQPAGRARRHQL